MTEQTVSLQPSESKVITFEAIPHEAKTYQVSVNGLSGSFRAIAVEVINGELLRGLAWWEDLPNWEQILSSNNWPANTAISTTWDVRNTGNIAATFKIEFMGQQGSIQVAPGEAEDIQFTVNTGGPGSYNYTYSLYGDNKLLDSESIEIIVIAPLAGRIHGMLIWHEPLTAWEDAFSGREIPLNEEIHLAPGWVNESEINIVGHINLSVTYPDGTFANLSAVLNQDREARPHSGWSVQFAPFLSTQEGTYTLEATLSSGGQVLNSVTFTLISAAVAPVETGFVYTNFVARKIVCPGATAFGAVEISCLISNPHNVSVTQDVAIMWARYSRTYGKWITCQGGFGGGTRIDCICDQMSNCLTNPFPVTLQPGESINFFYAGHCYPDPSDPSFHPCAPLLPRNYNWYWWLEDGTGNKSAERSFST